MARTALKSAVSILPLSGERAFVCGTTGSGKTALVCFILIRLDMSPIFIYDTKNEEKFPRLPNSRVVTNQDEANAAFADQTVDYIVYRPIEIHNADELDNILEYHYHHYPNSVAYVDELEDFASSGSYLRRGLKNILSRGRSRGITTIMATQRPSGIPLKAITESQKYYVLELGWADDFDKMRKAIPSFTDTDDLPKYGFYYYDRQTKVLTRYSAVPLDKSLDTGYVSEIEMPETELPDGPEKPGLIWF